jgi:hypothetical protein
MWQKIRSARAIGRDRDVKLAYQVVGYSGPDLLFVRAPRFPIDLIWDDPNRYRRAQAPRDLKS